MATLTAQQIVEAGLEATYAAAEVGGDEFINTGGEFIHIKNGDASDHTATITAQNTSASKAGYGALTKSDSVVVITAGEERLIGPFPTTAFNDSAGKAQITYEAVTGVTIAILKADGLVNKNN